MLIVLLKLISHKKGIHCFGFLSAILIEVGYFNTSSPVLFYYFFPQISSKLHFRYILHVDGWINRMVWKWKGALYPAIYAINHKNMN